MDRTSVSGALQTALATSLNSGSFADTIYYAFSSRRHDGTVLSPRPIYANSAVLKAAGEYFAARTPLFRLCRLLTMLKLLSELDGGFDTQQKITVVASHTYSYEDDSDLEDCADGGDNDDSSEETVLGTGASDTDALSEPEKVGNCFP